jgi:hypothetical protein
MASPLLRTAPDAGEGNSGGRATFLPKDVFLPERRHPMPNRSDLQHYPAQKARQGDIVLRHRWERVVFIAGLVAAVVVALLIAYGVMR